MAARGVLCLAALAALHGAHCRGASDAPREPNRRCEPRFQARLTAQPVLKLRKKMQACGHTLVVGCDYHIRGQAVVLDASWRDSLLGGDISLHDLRRLEWRKLVILPGLADAATKVEMVTGLNLRSGKGHAHVKLALRRRLSQPGLCLVKAFSLDKGSGHLSLDVGATLLFPEELSLSAGPGDSSASSNLEEARVEIDFDRFDLRVEY